VLMTMHPQTRAYLDYVAANNPMPADATLELRPGLGRRLVLVVVIVFVVSRFL
jgi:hypothetical protein